MTARGRKPATAADKKLRGNPGKRPIRTLVPVPPHGVVICPSHVAENPRAKTYWDMYLANAAPGHLAPIDAPLLARLCMCLARADEAEILMAQNMLVKAPNTGLPIQSPFMAIINRQTEIAVKIAANLALPPAERNRMGIHGAEDNEDPDEVFFRRPS